MRYPTLTPSCEWAAEAVRLSAKIKKMSRMERKAETTMHTGWVPSS